MSKWVPGQSGNPNGRPRRGRSVADLARAIAQERVEFVDEGETGTYSRLERLIRVLWTMALDGDLKAIRCLLEYMEGKPVQVVAATVSRASGADVSADELAKLLAGALERVEAWRNASGGNDTRNG